MDSRKHVVVADFSQSCNQNNELPSLFPSSSAFAIVSLRMAELCATIEKAFDAEPVKRENQNFAIKLLSSPFNAMTNLTKRFYKPLTDYYYYGSWEHITSLTRRITGLVTNLRHPFSTLGSGGSNDRYSTYIHLNELANQLEQLTENVANLQEANDEFKSKYHQENLLAEVGDMKGYLELLYRQLKQEEKEKLEVEEENKVLRQSIEKYSAIDCPRWVVSTRRESHENVDKFSNLYNLSASDHEPVRLFNISESKGNRNPPAVIETSLSEFQLKINYLYQEASVAWARPPKEGDNIVFTFHQPVLLKSFKIGTGHYEYPNNKLSDTTVEVLPTSVASSQTETQDICATSDSYLVVGRFDHSGLAEGIFDWQSIGTVDRLRVNIHSTHRNWVVMTELLLDTLPLDSERVRSEDYFESW